MPCSTLLRGHRKLSTYLACCLHDAFLSTRIGPSDIKAAFLLDPAQILMPLRTGYPSAVELWTRLRQAGSPLKVGIVGAGSQSPWNLLFHWPGGSYQVPEPWWDIWDLWSLTYRAWNKEQQWIALNCPALVESVSCYEPHM